MLATKRSRKHFKIRVLAFLVLHGLIIAHLISWYVYDHRVIGAIDMQELFRNLLEKGVLTAGALFFLILIGAGLIWGRLFCGWLCHIGQVYDLLVAGMNRWGLKMRAFPLRFGPVAAAFVLGYYFVRDALVNRAEATFSVDWGATEPWELLPGWINGTALLLLVWVVLPLIMGARTFCRNICPWGILLGFTNRFAPYKVRRVGDCTNCGACSPACPMDIDVSRRINVEFRVNSVACTNCLQCVAACPTEALAFTTRNKENREARSLPLLPPMKPIPFKKELLFWLLVCLVAFVYDEIYGVGIFLAWCLALLMAWCTLQWPELWRKARPMAVAAALTLLAGWACVGKDAMANHHWQQGHAAWEARDMEAVQHHYERADSLFWHTPTVLMYRLYMIYKATDQEAKRQALYDRYEIRRAKRKKQKEKEP